MHGISLCEALGLASAFCESQRLSARQHHWTDFARLQITLLLELPNFSCFLLTVDARRAVRTWLLAKLSVIASKSVSCKAPRLFAHATRRSCFAMRTTVSGMQARLKWFVFRPNDGLLNKSARLVWRAEG